MKAGTLDAIISFIDLIRLPKFCKEAFEGGDVLLEVGKLLIKLLEGREEMLRFDSF